MRLVRVSEELRGGRHLLYVNSDYRVKMLEASYEVL
jgi:hypothetical protein